MKKFKLNEGVLIAIEGVDGAGKTTQTIRLRDYFIQKGYKVSIFKEPTDGVYGLKIKDLAKNGRHTVTPEEELELFLKDRIQDCELNINPALKRNELVIIVRYYFSSVAYQGALGLEPNYILKRNEDIAITPNLVIILDVAVNLGLSRIRQFRNEKHNHFEKEDYLVKVRNIFNNMSASYIQLLDGSWEEDVVFNHLKHIVKNIIAPYSSENKNQIDMFANTIGKEKLIFSDN